MSALQHCNPDLRRYLLRHKLPDIFESLFSALAVNQPFDGRQFMIEKVKLLIENPELLESLKWDTFIDPEKKPLKRLQDLDFIWTHDDSEPTTDMFAAAYTLYNHNRQKECFYAFYSYWKEKKKSRQIILQKFNRAIDFHRTKFYRVAFAKWRKWYDEEKYKELFLIGAIQKIYQDLLMRQVFRAWNKVSEDAKKTKEYFEKIERGEIGDTTNDINRRNANHVKQIDRISLLPRQLAVNIFRFVTIQDLVNCSKVCHVWKELTQISVLWSRIDLANTDQTSLTSIAVINLLQKVRPFLCHLNVRGCNFLQAKAFKPIGDCRNLQDLNLSNCSAVTDDIIQEITLGCRVLLYLNISHTTISDASLRLISRNCMSLQYLNISYCINITNRGLQYLANGKGSQKLVYLDLSGCDQITKDGYRYLSKGCTRLNTMILNELPALSDGCLEMLINDSRNIRVLSILHSPLLTDAGMKYLCNSRKLQVLRIEGNNRFTDAAVKTLVRHSPELRFLYLVNVNRITDMSFKALGQAKCLQVLNTADSVRISDAGVRYLVEGHSGSKLRELNLTNCIRVSDVSMLRISQKCSSLTYANFSYCEHITDAGVELLASMVSLISIDLTGCNITDNSLIALGSNTRFKDIIVSECLHITDAGVQKLAPNVENLETFDLARVNLITDLTLKSLAFSCRRLRVVNFSGCELLTDQGMQYLCGVCHFIEKLNISGCRLITDRSLRFLRKGCRQIKVLNMLYCRSITTHAVSNLKTKIQAKILHSQDDTILQLSN